MPGSSVLHCLPEFAHIQVHWVSDAIQPSHPLLPTFLFLLSVFPRIRIFSNRFFASSGKNIRASASASALPVNIQGWFTLGLTCLISCSPGDSQESFLQHHSSGVSVLQCSAFFMVQLSHPYMATGKTIALTRWTFVGIVMSLLFNMLSMFVIAFLPRSKHLLISWLQSPSAVIFGAQENKVCHCFHGFPTYLPWSDETGCHDLRFLNVEF